MALARRPLDQAHDRFREHSGMATMISGAASAVRSRCRRKDVVGTRNRGAALCAPVRVARFIGIGAAIAARGTATLGADSAQGATNVF